eukprot:CAMPEP_0114403702 /NCGR_PEP_ID=MMETSP0102-20121206/19035_1 /TAXON_ID=38822 ORGANISM="Pteridomonas danica, Strain PT" /NCGR_SAMPLE_ID=MMETSP0102 /ASSEMBLY_ACC=CAM_ASM_000212 /LENGTH=384 /DNA_ID=CAMNT_0001568091 /DNA_START=927 /DNA_END=2081 /DNA_ORIENTATION=-
MTDLMESQLCLLNQHLHHQEHQEDEEQKHQEQRVSEATPFEQVEHDDGGRITVSELKLKIEEWTQFIADIDESTEDAITVVSDLLDFDKASNGMLSLERGIHNMYSLIENLKLNNNFDNNFNENNHHEENGSHLVVHGDFTKIQQVIRNLISNALKFTPKKGEVKISAQWHPDSTMSDKVSCPSNFTPCGSIIVKVKDSGAGMTPEQVGQLFQEGVQFDYKLQAGQGSGLGLWISKGVAEQHGGSLQATSEGKGYGAEFIFELPVCSLQKGDDEEDEDEEADYRKEDKEEASREEGGGGEGGGSYELTNVPTASSMKSIIHFVSKHSNSSNYSINSSSQKDDEDDKASVSSNSSSLKSGGGGGGGSSETTTEMRPFYAFKNMVP